MQPDDKEHGETKAELQKFREEVRDSGTLMYFDSVDFVLYVRRRKALLHMFKVAPIFAV